MLVQFFGEDISVWQIHCASGVSTGGVSPDFRPGDSHAKVPQFLTHDAIATFTSQSRPYRLMLVKDLEDSLKDLRDLRDLGDLKDLNELKD